MYYKINVHSSFIPKINITEQCYIFFPANKSLLGGGGGMNYILLQVYYRVWIMKNMMYHYSQLASAIRGEQWFDT